MLNKNALTHRVIPILSYHSFESSWKYSLEPSLFDEHMDYLRSKNYVSLTLSQYTSSQRLALSTKPFILTFNGAYKNLERILPILEKYNYKATIFVPTAYVGQDSLWLNTQGQNFKLLDWEALNHLTLMGMEIASHGHEHLQLDVIPEVLARHDISYSKLQIEDRLGQACTSFAYPYGYYNGQVKELVKIVGFDIACTTDDRVSTTESDPFALPRLSLTNSSSLNNFKTLLKQKDSGMITPYSLVRSSVSRQIRRWQSPLRDPQIIPDNEHAPKLPKHLMPEQTQPQIQNAAPSSILTQPDESNVVEHKHLPDTKLLSFTQENLSPEDRYHIEQQGEYLASCKAVLSAYNYPSMVEYQTLVGALAKLQEAQENHIFFDDFESIQKAHTDFEQAVTTTIKHHRTTQITELHQLLKDLNQLPTSTMHNTAERNKHVLEHYLVTLQNRSLSEVEISSARSLVANFKQRLYLHYRQKLSQLLEKATKHHALDFLKNIQHAMRLLEQSQFPNLDTLELSLKEKLLQIKQTQLTQRKTEKFNQQLNSLALSFEQVSLLNNESVHSVSSMIQHLKEEQLHFADLPPIMQDELILLLNDVKRRLKQLDKEYETATNVALNILTGDTLDKAFSMFDEHQIDAPLMLAQEIQVRSELKN